LLRSSGPSCASRILALATVAALLAVPASLSPARAAPQPIPFSLGFGPSSMAPVSGGVPVYAVGDTLWAESSNSSTIVTLVAPDFRSVASTRLQPQAIVPVYTFGTADPDGTWNLTVEEPGASAGSIVTSSIPVRFVNLDSHSVSVGPPSYSLSGGQMVISAPVDLGDSYDQELCGSERGAQGVQFPIPVALGAGEVAIAPVGGQFQVTTDGLVNSSFDFWFELYHPYAYDSPGSSVLTLKDLRVGESSPILIGEAGKTNTSVSWALPPREGRFEVRAFFQNSTVFEVSESRVLILDTGTWTPLDSCQANPVGTQGLTFDANLSGGPAKWTSQLYLMYRSFGVEGVARIPVAANLSSVTFLASTWQQPIQDARVDVAPDPGMLQSSEQGSTLYLLASRYPLTFNYSVGIGGIRVAAGSMSVPRPFSSENSSVGVARLDLHVVGSNSSLGALEIAGPTGAVLTQQVGVNRNSTFYLPAGTYTVTGVQGGDSQTAKVTLTSGSASSVTLDLTTVVRLEVILLVTGLIAAVANVLILALRSRGFRSRIGKPRPARSSQGLSS
jgi:hypothetical protein